MFSLSRPISSVLVNCHTVCWLGLMTWLMSIPNSSRSLVGCKKFKYLIFIRGCSYTGGGGGRSLRSLICMMYYMNGPSVMFQHICEECSDGRDRHVSWFLHLFNWSPLSLSKLNQSVVVCAPSICQMTLLVVVDQWWWGRLSWTVTSYVFNWSPLSLF